MNAKRKFKNGGEAIVAVLQAHPEGLSIKNIHLKLAESGYHMASDSVSVYVSGKGRLAHGIIKIEGRCKECGNSKHMYRIGTRREQIQK